MCLCVCVCLFVSVKNYFGLIGYYATRSETFSLCGIPTIFDSATREQKIKKNCIKRLCFSYIFLISVCVYKLLLQFSTNMVCDKPTYIQV